MSEYYLNLLMCSFGKFYPAFSGKKKLLFVLVICCSILSFNFPAEKNYNRVIPNITIRDSSFYIMNTKFDQFDFHKIKSLLGEARIEKHKHKIEMHRWGIHPDGSKGRCHFYETEVTDYYYIYDQLGIMLFTQNTKGQDSVPDKMLVYFGNSCHGEKNTFPYFPHKKYNGLFILQGDTLHQTLPLKNLKADPLTRKVEYFNSSYDFSSTGSTINNLYHPKKTWHVIHLDNSKEQKISYIEFM